MALTRIELHGRLVKPPVAGATPSGRPIVRLCLDCGQEPETLLLDVVVMDGAARNLSDVLHAGQWVSASGSLRAIRQAVAGGLSRQHVEVIASEVRCEQAGKRPDEEIDFSVGRAAFPAKV